MVTLLFCQVFFLFCFFFSSPSLLHIKSSITGNRTRGANVRGLHVTNYTIMDWYIRRNYIFYVADQTGTIHKIEVFCYRLRLSKRTRNIYSGRVCLVIFSALTKINIVYSKWKGINIKVKKHITIKIKTLPLSPSSYSLLVVLFWLFIYLFVCLLHLFTIFVIIYKITLYHFVVYLSMVSWCSWFIT